MQLEVTLERFRDGDISDLSSAQSALLGYQWSLAHRLRDDTHPALTAWTDVADMQAVDSTHVSHSCLFVGRSPTLCTTRMVSMLRG